MGFFVNSEALDNLQQQILHSKANPIRIPLFYEGIDHWTGLINECNSNHNICFKYPLNKDLYFPP
jgi:hypothetical protein